MRRVAAFGRKVKHSRTVALMRPIKVCAQQTLTVGFVPRLTTLTAIYKVQTRIYHNILLSHHRPSDGELQQDEHAFFRC